MKRVAFYVDGYNLYHSIAALSKTDPSKNYLKWVDLRKLFSFFVNPHEEEIADIFFFTATPTHTHPDIQKRFYQLTIDYQRFLKIKAIYGKFKSKNEQCKKCKAQWVRHEEKESDVNLAVSIVRDAYEKTYDFAYIVTQDSDMAPAVKLAERVNPGYLRLLTPPGILPSRELARTLRQKAAQIKEIHLQHALMPAQYTDEFGNIIVKRPAEYTPPA
ncbi:MAG: NYN domain-containing protein [Akkermansia sp.]|nr:NYN domain-containing protein [Akkermansia sp.]